MMWLVIVVVVVVVIALVLGRHHPPQGAESYRVMVDLHAIHRRFDVAHYKFVLRRDAADARRELRRELRKLDKRRGL
jgi:hypothetical protein